MVQQSFVGFLVLSVLAVESNKEASCGTWQKSYRYLHHSILKNNVPARYVVSIPVRAGLADNLTGLVTQFLFALLTNRAFLRTSYEHSIPLEEVFQSPRIELHNNSLPIYLFSCLLPPYPEDKSTYCVNESKIRQYGMECQYIQYIW